VKLETKMYQTFVLWTVVITVPVFLLSIMIVILWAISSILPKVASPVLASIAEPLIIVTSKLFKLRELKVRQTKHYYLLDARKQK